MNVLGVQHEPCGNSTLFLSFFALSISCMYLREVGILERASTTSTASLDHDIHCSNQERKMGHVFGVAALASSFFYPRGKAKKGHTHKRFFRHEQRFFSFDENFVATRRRNILSSPNLTIQHTYLPYCCS